jgi:uncharacterized integral membrane protein
MGLREISFEDGSWMELAQDRVQWQALVLAVLKFLVLLLELVIKMDLRETGCEDGWWMDLAQDRVQWQALILGVLKLLILLLELVGY